MSNLNAIAQLFGTDDLCSPRAVKEYLDQIRRVDRAACNELADTAEMLEQVIASSPGVGILLGWDSKRKARQITLPLHEAANAHNAAANLAVLAWQKFYKHFGETIESSQKPRGKRQMDWSDA